MFWERSQLSDSGGRVDDEVIRAREVEAAVAEGGLLTIDCEITDTRNRDGGLDPAADTPIAAFILELGVFVREREQRGECTGG